MKKKKKYDDQQAVKSVRNSAGEKKKERNPPQRGTVMPTMLLVTPEAALHCVHVFSLFSPFRFESSLSSFSFHALNFGHLRSNDGHVLSLVLLHLPSSALVFGRIHGDSIHIIR